VNARINNGGNEIIFLNTKNTPKKHGGPHLFVSGPALTVH
jgi:hypothetical protein